MFYAVHFCLCFFTPRCIRWNWKQRLESEKILRSIQLTNQSKFHSVVDRSTNALI